MNTFTKLLNMETIVLILVSFFICLCDSIILFFINLSITVIRIRDMTMIAAKTPILPTGLAFSISSVTVSVTVSVI